MGGPTCAVWLSDTNPERYEGYEGVRAKDPELYEG